MKKALSIAAVAALVAAAVSISVYVNGGRNEMDDLFYANVEALANDEGIGRTMCLQSYMRVGYKYAYPSCTDCRTRIHVDDSFTLAYCSR
ncbi:MAG: hypothetical protein K2J62_06860 [Bacteroidales bacterium]|nr:hypothetical protein [Bacteroidales bacterium]